MTLRELVQQAGGINSSQLDFEIDAICAGKIVSIREIEINNEQRRVHIELPAYEVRFLNKEITGEC